MIAEKDFWVVWLLGLIFETPELGGHALFKGGTSLSKVFGAISRFSEDIDLGISPEILGWPEQKLESASRNAWTEKIRPQLEADCARHVETRWLPLLESKATAILGSPPPATTRAPPRCSISELDALRCANALGKHWVERATRTVHQDHTAHTYQRVEEFRIKPHEFRNLPDHTAVVRHCTNGFRKVNLRPS